MGKLIVVSGPNESGKSAFAESLMSRIPGQRYYIATMVPQTEENYRRKRKARCCWRMRPICWPISSSKHTEMKKQPWQKSGNCRIGAAS